MSSNIRIPRVCRYCNNEFIAKTTVTKFCSDNCAKKAYKQRMRKKKIKTAQNENRVLRFQSYDYINSKDYLTVKEAATLLCVSIRTTYRLIEDGSLPAVNLYERLIRIKRSELDKIVTNFE
jgi:excisionase family DNA binding protein